jgi:hypothetical protein
MLATAAHASGRRTETITPESIADYPLIDIDAGVIPEPVLHYVGSTDHWHLLMITRTHVSSSGRRTADGRPLPGMPWDKVFSYRLPIDSLTLVNGWQLDKAALANGITVEPNRCPPVRLQPEQRYQVLPGQDSIRQRCLGTR